KPMLVSLPFLMLLLDYWPLNRLTSDNEHPAVKHRNWRLLVIEKIPFLLLSAGACGVTVWAQKNAMQPLDHLRLTDRIANAAVAYARYIGKAIWPAHLALPYLHPGQWPAVSVFCALSLLMLL